MFKFDEDILRTYFRLDEYRRHRIQMERLLHPEKFNWPKRGQPPKITPTKTIRIEELSKVGFGEEFYQKMLQGEKQTRGELEEMAELHPLWPHFDMLNGFGRYLCGAFIAAGGDIQRAPTAPAFWKGMGLDVLPDGTVPRRIRGRKNVERTVPALPHVTTVGEQIRKQILLGKGKLYEIYLEKKEGYRQKYPDRPKLFAHKHGLRIAQKILYSCLWKAWREAYHLPAPRPYAFDILRHNEGGMITISDLYDKKAQPGGKGNS